MAHGTGGEHSISFMEAVAFAMNYLMGTGFLTLPWACYEAGLGAGVLILGGACIIGIIAAYFVLETCARGQMLEEHYPSGCSGSGKIATNFKYSSIHSSEETGLKEKVTIEREDYIIDDLRIEVPVLCEIFLGNHGRRFFVFLIVMNEYAALWAYCVVFANALAANFPLMSNWSFSYFVYNIVFGLIVVPLSCMELNEQVLFQVILAWGRVLIVSLMSVTTIMAYFSKDNPFGLETGDRVLESRPFVVPSGIYILLPIAMFANIFHHSIPSLAEPVRRKSELGSIYATALFVCFVMYVAISILISTYFGDTTKSSSNLMWAHYGQGTIIGRMISFYIVLFPAFDVISAYPLNAITLGNNLMSFIIRDRQLEKDRLTRVKYRVFAALPPVIGAFFISDLGVVSDGAGLAGFVMTLIFPAFLSIYSKRRMQEAGLPWMTKYTNFLTNMPFAIFTIIFTSVMLVFVVGSMIWHSADKN